MGAVDFYKEIVQLVLLYRRESWVVMGDMIKLIEGFYHQAAIQIEGMTAHCTTSGEWE